MNLTSAWLYTRLSHLILVIKGLREPEDPMGEKETYYTTDRKESKKERKKERRPKKRKQLACAITDSTNRGQLCTHKCLVRGRPAS